MTRTIAVAMALLIALVLPLAAHEGKHDAKAGDVTKKETITGELIDTRCYLAHGGKGAEHQQCATLCAKDGQPAGLLTDQGKVYVLIVPPRALAEVMALQAEVTGSVYGEAIIPDTLKVKKGASWQPVKLPEHM